MVGGSATKTFEEVAKMHRWVVVTAFVGKRGVEVVEAVPVIRVAVAA